MGLTLIAAVLLAGTAAPAAAQRTETVEQRIQRIEQQLRAVQRRVFPGGRAQFVEPEISAEAATRPPPATSDAMINLTARVDALEAQLRTLTGQVEEQGFRTRQLEQQIGQLRTDLQVRLDRLEPPPPAPAETQAPAEPEPDDRAAAPAETPAAPTEPAAAPAANSAEEAYNAGFRLWNARQYAEAQQALEAAATRYANTRWTSWMRNLQGRAYLDDDKPATAARIFLANYQDNPQGERAADSLYYLGQALTRLDRRPEACRVYAELEQVYPNMRGSLRDGLPRARTDARCGAAASR